MINISCHKIKMINHDNYVAFDFETTGLNIPCKIIEIGAVKVINGEMIEKYQTLVNPCCNLPSIITQITNITDEMLKGKPTIEEVLPDFVDFIGDYTLVAHNAPFDTKFLRHYARLIDVDINNEVIDTLKLCRKYLPEIREQGLRYRLGDVASFLSIPEQTYHRALGDAVTAAYLYDYLRKNY